MPVSTKVGTFAANTSTGNQTVSGVGFQPKLVFLSGIPKTSAGFLDADGSVGGGVFAENNGQIAWAVYEAAAGVTTDGIAGLFNDRCFQLYSNSSAGSECTATFVSLNADGFTINWTDAPGSAWLLGYYAIGGDDILDAYVGTIGIDDGVTGDVPYTGLGFRPDLLLLATHGGVNNSPFFAGWGVSNETAEHGVMAGWIDQNLPASSNGYAQETKVLVHGSGARGTLDSFDADGFTLNITTDPNQAETVGVVAIRGGDHYVGNHLVDSNGAEQTVTGFQARGVMSLQVGSSTDNGSVTPASGHPGIGFTDGTNQHLTCYSGAGTSDASTFTNRFAGFQNDFADTDASSGATLGTLDEDGFTPSYVNEADDWLVWWAIGDGNDVRASFDFVTVA